MHQVSRISAGQFAVFRIIFGAYLLQHFLALLPVAAEVFSHAGVLADPRAELFRGSTSIGVNDNWGGTAALVSANEIGRAHV
jgi:hypothetical protein